MVLELLINPKKAEREPWELFFIGLVYSSVAIFLSLYIFKQYVGVVMVFLTTLACTYLIQGTLRREEKKDIAVPHELALLKEHGKALSYFMFLFLGFVVSFSLWYIFLPQGFSSQIFSIQEETIRCINSVGVEGCLSAPTESFVKIFLNNFKVLLFVLIFAFFYGAGSVFILAWNATVVATAIGIFVRNSLSSVASSMGLTAVADYFSSYSLALLRYLTHGGLEILAYFIAALAGGIISVAVARHSFASLKFRKVLWDSVDLIALSLGTLFLAAIVEVFVTPMLFG
ncbi:stage II sporulation protein M [Candidatus Woesearchaeota archaeon]|nr:stage II sporulation protein M [Candidatus Woesearchaeota archaeon]